MSRHLRTSACNSEGAGARPWVTGTRRVSGSAAVKRRILMQHCRAGYGLVPKPSDRCHRPPSSPALLPLTREPNQSLPHPLCHRAGAPVEVPPHQHRPLPSPSVLQPAALQLAAARALPRGTKSRGPWAAAAAEVLLHAPRAQCVPDYRINERNKGAKC